MIKKCIVSMALLGAAVAAQAGNFTILHGFYMDQVDAHTGGDSMVHWDDGSLTWANHFAVHIDPYFDILNNPDGQFTIQNWIKPVTNGGATFEPVELFAVWGQQNEVFATSMGNGVDLNFSNHLNVLVFSNDQASWQVTLTPVTSVPEPETYAMLLAGLGLIGGIARRRKEQRHIA